MTNEEALELGLVMAELNSQLKARETLASLEEAGEMLRSIMARRAAEKQQRARAKPWKPIQFSEKALAAAMKHEDEERAYQASVNPKGVPIIFPSYD